MDPPLSDKRGIFSESHTTLIKNVSYDSTTIKFQYVNGPY